jgi:type II secretory pathway pseudopilin PulG
MQDSRSGPASRSSRWNSMGCLSLIGLMGIGLISLGFWWTAAVRSPVVKIPNRVTPSPNAFDFYVAAGNAMVSSNTIGDIVSPIPSGPYSLARKEAIVQQNAGAINILHQGFAYPYLNPASLSTPTYALFRGLARLLFLRGNVQAAKGDWSGAVDSYLDSIRLGEDIPHGALLLGVFAGSTCQSYGRQYMWGAVEHLNAAQSRAAATCLASILERHLPFADTIQEEKWYGQSVRMVIFRDSKHRDALFRYNTAANTPGTAVKASFSNLAYFVYSKNRIMDDFTAYMDSAAARARRPYAAKQGTLALPKDPINSILTLDYTQSRLRDVIEETENALLTVILALHAFRLEHGHYPVALAELTPAYLKKLPDDPFAMQGTFKYRLKGNSYVLYSVGPDDKDDGGTAIDGATVDDPKNPLSSNPNARYFIKQNSVGDVVAGKNRW